MTSFNRAGSVANLLRTIVDASVERAISRTRIPSAVGGTAEALNDEDLSVVWVRNDGAALSGDPTLSDNWGMPGAFPSVRIGEVFEGDQVRTTFQGAQGPTSSRTSALKQIVIPFGAEDGELIRIAEEDGKGYIAFFNGNGDLVGFLDPTSWEIGDLVTPGRRITIDPVGGIRIRSETDKLVVLMDDQGVSIRDPETGLVTAEMKSGSFRMVDPNGTDDVEIVTSSQGTLPNPSFSQLGQAVPGASITVPAATVFTTTPADDIDILHMAAYERAVSQAATATIPAGWVEQDDSNHQDASGTLQSSTATRDPANGATVDFTSSQSNWDHAVGTHVVIKGGGPVSPSFRSKSTDVDVTTETTFVASLAKPAGAAAGDAMLVFVDLGVNGGGVPTGWITPTGFIELGAWFSSSGTGDTQTTCASGCWLKHLGASEPVTYETTINLPPGVKIISATAICIQNPFTVPGGVQIRMAGKPIRRLLAYTELQVAAQILCDFQNIPQGYDNLELVWDGLANGTGTTTQLRVRFNGDNTGVPPGGHYHYQVVRATSPGSLALVSSGLGQTAIRFNAVANAAGSKSAGSLRILGYNSSPKPAVMGEGWYTDGTGLRSETYAGHWDGNGGVSAIDRIEVVVDAVTNPKFAIGARAYLYGY